MEGTFTLDSLKNTRVVSVTKAEFTIRDRRNGQFINLTIYRPGGYIQKQELEEEIGKYGYEVYALDDIKTIKCNIPWGEVYETYLARIQAEEQVEEGEYD